jgi:MipA family protein
MVGWVERQRGSAPPPTVVLTTSEVAMPSRLLALVALLWPLPVAVAAAPTPPEAVVAAPPTPPVRADWSVTVGAGVLVVPAYPGASSSRLMSLPFVEVKYRQRFFLSPVTGVGFNAIATRRLQAGVAVLPDFGRSTSSSERLQGWGNVSSGVKVKAFGRYSLGPVSLLADVRRQFGAGDGTLIDAGVTSMLPLARRVFVVPTVKLTWANARYSRAYFGVDASQASAALAHGTALRVYSAGAGLRDAGLSLLGVVRLDERWSVLSFARIEILLGDAAASPLVVRRMQTSAGGLLAYRL